MVTNSVLYLLSVDSVYGLNKPVVSDYDARLNPKALLFAFSGNFGDNTNKDMIGRELSNITNSETKIRNNSNRNV